MNIGDFIIVGFCAIIIIISLVRYKKRKQSGHMCSGCSQHCKQTNCDINQKEL